jgi:hypothetical protein
MGRYYGVRAVMRLGQRIGNIEEMLRGQPHVQGDEALIGIVSNAAWLTAPDLSSAYEYEAFRKEYARGGFVAIILYKVKISDLTNCPDEGQVDTDEFKDSKELYEELLGMRKSF